jgi:hypothetical protein
MVQLPKMIENLKEDTFELQFSGEAEVDGEVGECLLAPEGLLALSEGRGPPAPELSVPPKVKRETKSQSTGGHGAQAGKDVGEDVRAHRDQLAQALDRAIKQAAQARVYAVKLRSHSFKEMSGAMEQHCQKLEALWQRHVGLTQREVPPNEAEVRGPLKSLTEAFVWFENLERTMKSMERDVFVLQAKPKGPAKSRTKA